MAHRRWRGGNRPPEPGVTLTEVDSAPTRLSTIDRWQPALLLGSIALGLAVGRSAPAVGAALSPLVTVGVFALIYVVLLGLDAGSLGAAIGHRRFLVVAVGLNFVANPLLAWSLGVGFLSDQPDLLIGFILFLVTPCIGWYLVFTELAGGDVPLAVSLLGINVVLQVLLLPLYLFAFTGSVGGADLSTVIANLALFLVGPAVAAIVTHVGVRRSGAVGAAVATIDRGMVKAVLLATVIVAMFASEADTIADNPGVVVRLLPPLLLFFAAAFMLAVVVGRWAGFSPPQVVALVFTATSRNSEASLAVAATAFGSPLVALAVVLGPVVELPLLVVMVRGLQALNRGRGCQSTQS